MARSVDDVYNSGLIAPELVKKVVRVYEIRKVDPYLGTTLLIFDAEKEAGECPRCVREFEDKEVLRQVDSCEHVFHDKCFLELVLNQNNCPLCGGPLLIADYFCDGLNIRIYTKDCKEIYKVDTFLQNFEMTDELKVRIQFAVDRWFKYCVLPVGLRDYLNLTPTINSCYNCLKPMGYRAYSYMPMNDIIESLRDVGMITMYNYNSSGGSFNGPCRVFYRGITSRRFVTYTPFTLYRRQHLNRCLYCLLYSFPLLRYSIIEYNLLEDQ